MWCTKYGDNNNNTCDIVYIYNNNDDECGIPPAILVHIIIVIIIRVWYVSLCRYPITIIYNIWTCDRFIRDEHCPTISAQLPSFVSEPLVLLLLYYCCQYYHYAKTSATRTSYKILFYAIALNCRRKSPGTTVYRNKLGNRTNLWLL